MATSSHLEFDIYLCLPLKALIDIFVTIFLQTRVMLSVIINKKLSKVTFQGSHFEMAAILNWAIFGSSSISKNTFFTMKEICVKFHTWNTKWPKIVVYPRNIVQKWQIFSVSILFQYRFIIQHKKVTPRVFQLIMIIQMFIDKVCLVS